MQSYGILNGAGADMEPVPDTNHFRVFTEMRAHMDSLKVTGKEPFRIVLEEAQGEIEEKKSRFIATIRPIETEEEALQVVEQLKKKYWDARHNCYAYILQGANPVVRCSDDGEPQGTAGRPMLEVLTGANLQGVVAVVTRYFGGTLLGTGGLVRAYTAAVQEEGPGLGGQIATYQIHPDIAFAFDVGHGWTEDLPRDEMLRVGGGPALAIGGRFHPGMVRKFIAVCEKFGIPYQLEPTPAASGTDAESIQTNRDGVPVLLISIPLRYMHTGVETGSVSDIENIGKAVAHMISEIDRENWEGLLCY